MSAYRCLLEARDRWPDRTLVEFWDRRVSFGQAADDALKVAGWLQSRGVSPGDAVGVALPNIPSFVPVHFGVLMRGCVFVPLNVLLTPAEIAYQAGDSRLKAIFVYEMFAQNALDAAATLPEPPLVIVVGTGETPAGAIPYGELLVEAAHEEALVEVEPSAPLMTIYTSGTTGKPKGAQLTGLNLEAMLTLMADAFPLGVGDKFLCILPLFHVFALNSILHPAVRQGATVVMQPRWDLEACLHALAEQGITMFAGVPTMYFYILQAPQAETLRFPQLRYCVSGGAPLPLETLTQFEERYGVPIYEGYGLTETTVCVAVNRPGRRRPGSIGQPFDGLEVRVVDDDGGDLPRGATGELLVRGPTVTPGYLNRPAETAEAIRDGWLYTGDLARQDEDGYLYIVDRKKDMILKGGFNIYPREIEEKLYELPEIAEAAVIGVPNEAKGEDVAAIVAFKPGQRLAAAALVEHLHRCLAKYKLPRFFAALPDLPKGVTGKILKRELRDLWRQIPPLA